MKRPSVAPVLLMAAVLAGVLVAPHRAAAEDPLKSVRRFCEEDGHGVRLEARTWTRIAPLVSWTLEPAWDHLLLISGYEIGTPHLHGSGVEVEVKYTVTAEIQPGKVVRGAHIESRTLHLTLDETSGIWRIDAPPPPPHLFEAQVDADAMASALSADEGSYLSSSAFVWRLLRQSGWDVPYRSSAELLSSDMLRDREVGIEGDLVAWLDGGTPYQVGLIESPGVAVTTTLNGGMRRVPLASFAGEVRYRSFSTYPTTPTPSTPAPVTPEASASPAPR